MVTFTDTLKPRLIYIFAIPDDRHEGCLKIGETTLTDDFAGIPEPNSEPLNKAARERIDRYTKTAGTPYELLHTEITLFFSGGKVTSFNDKQVHDVLLRSGIKRKEFKGASEWFVTDLDTAKKAITAVKEGRRSLTGGEITTGHTPIILRPEQREAVDKAKKQFSKKGKKKMLWNAKMRFGKTICTLSMIKEMDFARTIVITHRPVVDDQWFEDYQKVFMSEDKYLYGSKHKGESFESLEKQSPRGKKYIYFASIQDLRGSETVGGKFDKNDALFSVPWDCVVIDEAHEGTQTALGQAVISELTKHPETKTLALSGTPFNLFADYAPGEIYTWDYIMEQKAKSDWDLLRLGEPNPYAALPAINIYTYDLGSILKGAEGDYADGEKAFNFREFFRTGTDGAFVHDKDVDGFLDLLSRDDEESLYPFSNARFRETFRHTLWVLPGVKAAKALSQKLRSHPVFGAFEVVNVAGDGDEDEENSEALQMVNKAIGPDAAETYTITLTCGRLTTGVSVKAWTGVLMLSGSYSTSAASYMQTIFRVQTPFTLRGRMKTDCYAFDFAPDRTLRILAETAGVSHKAGKQTSEDRQVLGDFLNFCPVIAIDGSRMHTLDVPRMLGRLKRAQIERVVRGGFEDGALYSDELLKVGKEDLLDFDELKSTIGVTRAMAKTADVDINRQGLTAEQYARKEAVEKKPKKARTPEEEKLLEELKARASQRRNLISVLRGISIRMPLLLYGADIKDEDKELTIDNFTTLVDDRSWDEFLPKGVTKGMFNKFKKYYDPDVFREAGKRIREMARMADKFSIEERIERITDIFSTFHNPDKETVLTPWRVVNMHLARSLGGYAFCDESWEKTLSEPRFVAVPGVTEALFRPDAVLMEINSKTGLYPLCAAYTLYRIRLKEWEEKYGQAALGVSQSLWDAVLEDNILALCKTPMAASITRRTLAGFRPVTVRAEYFKDLIDKVIADPSAVTHTLKSPKFWGYKHSSKDMKIDAVIGNPPYQLTTENNQRSRPIYPLFMDLAISLSQRVTLITPGRYLFNAGFTSEEWNNKMLNDEHFRVVSYTPSSTDVFPNVDIKGGVAIMYRDSQADFGKIGTFKAFPELDGIERKVSGHPSFAPLTEITYAESSYRFDTSKPEVEQLVKERLSNDRKIISDVFKKLPDIFTDEKREGKLGFIGRSGNVRAIKYIDPLYIEAHPNLSYYKVAVPESNGTGAIGEVLSTPLIGEPLIGVTQTFLTIGAFETREEAEACLKYVKTRFARTLLGILKVTQHNPKDTWRLVPLQDFTPNSDIDWTQSVDDIDRQLYAKYGLTESEIAFITARVRPMP